MNASASRILITDLMRALGYEPRKVTEIRIGAKTVTVTHCPGEFRYDREQDRWNTVDTEHQILE